MSLISFSFILFMPLVVFVNFMLPRRRRYLWLLAASCFFYLSTDVRYAAGLFFCILVSYAAGLLLEGGALRRRKLLLGCGILLQVSCLLFFRGSFGKGGFVPLGISFYTLQSIGYTIDVYRRQIPAERNLLRYAAFLSFFPTVISGPIQRGTGLLQQLREGRDFDYSKARSGLYCLLWGYLLKLVVADRLGGMVAFAYGSSQDMPGATLLWATILYGIQLYCDFAGYSALAIGAGRLLGFDLADNFSQPYFAASIGDFWNRWHISLSSWLRDYVYIPLGGNRKGKGRKYLNLMLTFLVSGLWHGSGANFLLWGALHGAYQVLGDIARGKAGGRDAAARRKSPLCRAAGMLSTFALADFAWLFFRADSLGHALSILNRIVFHFGLGEMTYYGSYLLGGSRFGLVSVLLGILGVFLVDFLHERKLSLAEFSARRVNVVVRWGTYIALTLLILLTVVQNYGQAASTFLYERF